MDCDLCHKEINPEHLPAARCSHCREVRWWVTVASSPELKPVKFSIKTIPTGIRTRIRVPKELL